MKKESTLQTFTRRFFNLKQIESDFYEPVGVVSAFVISLVLAILPGLLKLSFSNTILPGMGLAILLGSLWFMNFIYIKLEKKRWNQFTKRNFHHIQPELKKEFFELWQSNKKLLSLELNEKSYRLLKAWDNGIVPPMRQLVELTVDITKHETARGTKASLENEMDRYINSSKGLSTPSRQEKYAPWL